MNNNNNNYNKIVQNKTILKLINSNQNKLIEIIIITLKLKKYHHRQVLGQPTSARGHNLPINAFQNAHSAFFKTYFKIKPLVTCKFAHIFIFLIQNFPANIWFTSYKPDLQKGWTLRAKVAKRSTPKKYQKKFN